MSPDVTTVLTNQNRLLSTPVHTDDSHSRTQHHYASYEGMSGTILKEMSVTFATLAAFRDLPLSPRTAISELFSNVKRIRVRRWFMICRVYCVKPRR